MQIVCKLELHKKAKSFGVSSRPITSNIGNLRDAVLRQCAQS